jgi:hypothetical protein
MLIVNTFKENPALAVAKMKKAGITRRMKMLLSILDNYADLSERNEELLLFLKELSALRQEKYNIEFAVDNYLTAKKNTQMAVKAILNTK